MQPQPYNLIICVLGLGSLCQHSFGIVGHLKDAEKERQRNFVVITIDFTYYHAALLAELSELLWRFTYKKDSLVHTALTTMCRSMAAKASYMFCTLNLMG
jgi:hypothetical protein